MSDSDAYSGEYSSDDEPTSNSYSDCTSDEDSYDEPISNASSDATSDEDSHDEQISNASSDGTSDDDSYDETILNASSDGTSDEDSYNKSSTYSYRGGDLRKSYYGEPSSKAYHGHSSRTSYGDNRIVGFRQSHGSQQSKVRELTSRVKKEDKETGAYERVTTKEKTSRGETHFEKPTGRYGIVDEYRNSTTVKIGDKSGYTEYYHEDRVRMVNYDGTSNGRLRLGGNKNTSISVDRRGVGIQKNHTRVSVSHGKNKSTSLSITKHR